MYALILKAPAMTRYHARLGTCTKLLAFLTPCQGLVGLRERSPCSSGPRLLLVIGV